MRHGQTRQRHGNRGAILLLMLFAVAVVGILLAVAGPVWRTEMRRDKEAELLWVGQQYADAIASYQAAAAPPQLPERLGQLLLDARQVNVVRHLRRLYRDPMTGGLEWGLVRDGAGRIAGVYSLGHGVPLKQGGFDAQQSAFAGAGSYADWKFTVQRAATAATGDGVAAPVVPVMRGH
jgi:type II secretory pathway pseudopilin PulG